MTVEKTADVELRQAERFVMRQLKIEYDGRTDTVPLRAPDLSTRGMFINTPQPFPFGAVLHLRFQLAITGKAVVTFGTVRYCLPGVGVGVEFIELSDDARETISGELQHAM